MEQLYVKSPYRAHVNHTLLCYPLAPEGGEPAPCTRSHITVLQWLRLQVYVTFFIVLHVTLVAHTHHLPVLLANATWYRTLWGRGVWCLLYFLFLIILQKWMIVAFRTSSVRRKCVRSRGSTLIESPSGCKSSADTLMWSQACQTTHTAPVPRSLRSLSRWG